MGAGRALDRQSETCCDKAIGQEQPLDGAQVNGFSKCDFPLQTENFWLL